jgi:hypothetical protein
VTEDVLGVLEGASLPQRPSCLGRPPPHQLERLEHGSRHRRGTWHTRGKLPPSRSVPSWPPSPTPTRAFPAQKPPQKAYLAYSREVASLRGRATLAAHPHTDQRVSSTEAAAECAGVILDGACLPQGAPHPHTDETFISLGILLGLNVTRTWLSADAAPGFCLGRPSWHLGARRIGRCAYRLSGWVGSPRWYLTGLRRENM